MPRPALARLSASVALPVVAEVLSYLVAGISAEPRSAAPGTRPRSSAAA